MALPIHVEALLHPGGWPFAGETVRLVQTHISYVLIGENDVLKLKKPVKLPFLDLSTLESRRAACEAEVRLNRRSCSSIYLGVSPIVVEDGSANLTGQGDVIDWAVHMRRLPAERSLERMLAEDRVTIATLGRLVSHLVDYYAQAETSERITSLGGIETFAANWRDLLENIADFVSGSVSQRQLERLNRFAESSVSQLEPLLRKRAGSGYVRDCHGDLRADSVYLDLADTAAVCLIDCIEFDERYRYQDIALDIAFLAMDIEYRGRRDLSDVFVGLYAAATPDPELPLLMPAMKCYRALVRALVECTLSVSTDLNRVEKTAAGKRAREYIRLALSYVGHETRPGLLTVSGPSGSGKSVLAGALASRLGASLLATDAIRRELGASSGRDTPVDAESYRPGQRLAVYAELGRRVEDQLSQNHTVVADGTFSERMQRELVLEAAERLSATVLFVECQASEDVIRERQQRRTSQSWNASEGTWEVYLAQKARWEDANELPDTAKMSVDTTLALGDQIDLVDQRWLKGGLKT